LKRQRRRFDPDQGGSRADQAPFLRIKGGTKMPQGEIIYLAGVVVAFVVFAVTIFWVDRQTRNLPR
jgi:hypothetical protein